MAYLEDNHLILLGLTCAEQPLIEQESFGCGMLNIECARPLFNKKIN